MFDYDLSSVFTRTGVSRPINIVSISRLCRIKSVFIGTKDPLLIQKSAANNVSPKSDGYLEIFTTDEFFGSV